MKVHGFSVIAALAASLLLAGCTSTPGAAPAVGKTPTASATAASDEDCVICDPDGEIPSEGSQDSAVDEAVNCASLIGAPSSEVLAEDHKPTCAVVPGNAGILYGTTTCVGASSEPVYFWTATDEDDPDHSIYQVFAIREGGTLGTVDDAAKLYAALDGVPGISYMQAAGCPGMEKS